MSDDLVQRLKKTSPRKGWSGGAMGDTMREAAAEIERLRAANDDLDMACSLRDAEIERLHAVLQGMATVEPNPRLSGPTAGWEMAERLLSMAQAALGEADDDEGR